MSEVVYNTTPIQDLPFTGRFLARLSGFCALVGGAILSGLALMTVASIIGRNFMGAAIDGDYELVEFGLGIAVFLFLPECYRQRGHVVVDIFTMRAPLVVQHWLERTSDLLFFALSVLFAWRLYLGSVDAFDYMEQSMILELPLGVVFVVGVACSVLVALLSVERLIRRIRGGY